MLVKLNNSTPSQYEPPPPPQKKKQKKTTPIIKRAVMKASKGNSLEGENTRSVLAEPLHDKCYF